MGRAPPATGPSARFAILGTVADEDLTATERAAALASLNERGELFEEQSYDDLLGAAAGIAAAHEDAAAGRKPRRELLEAAANAPATMSDIAHAVARDLDLFSDSVELTAKRIAANGDGTTGELDRDAASLRRLAMALENIRDVLRFRRAVEEQGWLDEDA